VEVLDDFMQVVFHLLEVELRPRRPFGLSPLLFGHRLERVLHLPDELVLLSRLLVGCL
jgi:hypothetical protein